MNVWRFHDHAHIGKRDLIYDGLLRELGWESYRVQVAQAPQKKKGFVETVAQEICRWRYDIPKTTVGDLVEELKQKHSR